MKITLEFNNRCKEAENCRNPSAIWYEVLTNINATNPHRIVIIDNPIYDESIDLMRYIIAENRGYPAVSPNKYLVYFSGSVRDPDVWYYCHITASSPACESLYQLQPGLWVKLFFSYALIGKHRSILSSLNQKLSAFITTGE